MNKIEIKILKRQRAGGFFFLKNQYDRQTLMQTS